MRWGGAAGDGLQSTGLLLQKYFNRLGYHVQGFPGTQSTIRGGHVWQHVEIAEDRIESFDRPLDILVCLNKQTLQIHGRDMKEAGVVIYNGESITDEERNHFPDSCTLILAPLTKMAREVNLQTPVLANTVAVGIVLKLVSLDVIAYEAVLRRRFGRREEIINMNLEALKKGYEFYQTPELGLKDPKTPSEERLVISGNEMIALGAAASGLKFLAQYPITPASSILTYLANRSKKLGIVVRQAEDELAAINMIIGAAYAGARAMTASSGPGLSLMAESFGYASMTETPLVVVNSMRGGPSTGIPTKMEQSDLNSMIHLSHGEAPRIILAPRSISEAFDITVRAFNLADRFQIPVIILSDFALSERTENIEPFDMDVQIDRGKIWNGDGEYLRYKITDDGISPRVFPGTEGGQYILVGAEHDEGSHSLSGNRCGIPSSWDVRDQMIAKRYRKFELIRKELSAPKLIGKEKQEVTLICWGSTEGAVYETMQKLVETGYSVNMLSFADIYPLPFEKVSPYLEEINTSIMIEVNYTGQLENLIHQHLNWRPDYTIHPLSG
ncbi:MAG: 2-oxoacid:acceptor oxidoreductase subunit alpha, partial [Candidatus Kariarchaeaceae archaeon]